MREVPLAGSILCLFDFASGVHVLDPPDGVQDTRGTAFDHNSRTLIVQATGPLVASQLNNHFAITFRRVIPNGPLSVRGVSIAHADFVARARHPRYTADHGCTSP